MTGHQRRSTIGKGSDNVFDIARKATRQCSKARQSWPASTNFSLSQSGDHRGDPDTRRPRQRLAPAARIAASVRVVAIGRFAQDLFTNSKSIMKHRLHFCIVSETKRNLSANHGAKRICMRTSKRHLIGACCTHRRRESGSILRFIEYSQAECSKDQSKTCAIKEQKSGSESHSKRSEPADWSKQSLSSSRKEGTGMA